MRQMKTTLLYEPPLAEIYAFCQESSLLNNFSSREIDNAQKSDWSSEDEDGDY